MSLTSFFILNPNSFVVCPQLFTKARATAPSILFLDELDAIVGKRSGTSSTGVAARLLSTLLNEMDGIGTLANIYQTEERKSNSSLHGEDSDSCNEQLMRNDCGSGHFDNEQISPKTQRLNIISSSTVKDVLIVAATNRPDAIDEALLRPGRIDRIIYVPPPDVEARLQILRVHTRSSPLAEDVDLEEFALNTELFSGADLENLCREVRDWKMIIFESDIVQLNDCEIVRSHHSKIGAKPTYEGKSDLVKLRKAKKKNKQTKNKTFVHLPGLILNKGMRPKTLSKMQNNGKQVLFFF